MEPIPIVFAIIGGIAALIGGIMLLVAAFRVSVWWGVAYLLVPFASLVFLFKHWEEARQGFWINLLGALILCGAVFSTPNTRKNVKNLPAAVKLPMVEKQKPVDLNAQIEAKRAEIDRMEAQFAQQGAAVTQQFQALNARRSALKPGDAPAVDAFNAEAAAYQQANTALKQLRQQIDEAQRDLGGLLDERSRKKAGGKPGASNTRTISFDRSPAASAAAPARRASAPVVIFSTSHCGWCTRAKQYFASKGVSYEERDIERSPDAEAEFKRLGGRGVPLILVGSEKIEGFDQRRLDQLL